MVPMQNYGLYLQATGAFIPRSSDGHRQTIVMNAQAHPELLKVEANAQHDAIDYISGPKGMTSRPTEMVRMQHWVMY